MLFRSINSVEFRKPDEVILHQFEGDTDYEISYDELDDEFKKYIHKLLTILVYN